MGAQACFAQLPTHPVFWLIPKLRSELLEGGLTSERFHVIARDDEATASAIYLAQGGLCDDDTFKPCAKASWVGHAVTFNPWGAGWHLIRDPRSQPKTAARRRRHALAT
jgi:hypothetical protein